MLWLLQAATDSTVAHAANVSSAAWSAEQWRDLLVGVIGALWLGFITWQNNLTIKQNVVHEENARDRAGKRGDPDTPTRPFPGAKG